MDDTVNDAVTTVLAGLATTRPWVESFYQDLHARPELSHQETRTADRVAQRLRQSGCTVHEHVGGTGVVGVLDRGEGPTVLLRADMDALPVREATGLDYASAVTATDADGTETPVMHACGHDVHVACLLGAVDLLASAPEAWSGRLVAVFQPAEEVADGARGMLDDGLADLVGSPGVALCQHVLPMPAGVVATRVGPVLSAADSMRITVHGRGAHGSMPQASVDPVVLAALIVVRLQTVISREVQPGEPAVLTVGSIQAGTKSNVIPDHATIQLNVRTYHDATRQAVLDAIRRIVTAECDASGSPEPPEFELFDRFPPHRERPGRHRTGRGCLRRALRRLRAGAAAADRERGLLRPPPRPRRPLHLLGHRRHRPRPLRARSSGGADRPGRARQPRRDVRPRRTTHLDTGTSALVVAALAWLGHTPG